MCYVCFPVLDYMISEYLFCFNNLEEQEIIKRGGLPKQNRLEPTSGLALTVAENKSPNLSWSCPFIHKR